MLFSIITPCYNNEKFVEQCIESVLAQTETDFEFILIDDGSTDGVGKILDKYTEKDSRIKVIHKENGGPGSARKAGTQIAKGDYVVPIDGDDWIDESYLEEIKKVVEQYNVDVVMCGHCKVSENGAKEYVRIMPIRNHYGLLSKEEIETDIRKNPFRIPQYQHTKAIKRNLFMKYQAEIDDTIKVGEDECLIYSLVCSAPSIYLLDTCHYYYRTNPTSITKDKKNIYSMESVVEKLKYLDRMLPEDVAEKKRFLSQYACRHFMGASMSLFRNFHYVEAKAKTKLFIKQNPVISEYLRPIPIGGSLFDKISYIVLRLRLYFMIKLFSVLK